MKQSHGTKYKIVLMSITLLVLASLVTLLFFMIKKSSEHASLLDQTLSSSPVNSAYKGVSEKQARESITEEINKINSYLVDKDGSVGLIEMVESEAAEDNIALTISSVGTEKFAEADTDSATKEFIRLKLDGQGKWSDINYFLSFIEHLPYGINISEVTLSQISAEKNKQPIWRAKIELTVLKHK